MQLSVLSALTRLGLDPWKEAAELSQLPKNCAAQRLALLIVQLPGACWTLADAEGIAHRVIGLLPSSSGPDVPPNERPSGYSGMGVLPGARMLICVALVGIALFSATSCDPSSGADMDWFRTTATTLDHARR